MSLCFFVSDLHGKISRYQKLFDKIEEETPDAIFLGGDLLPSGLFAFTNDDNKIKNFLADFLIPKFIELKNKLADRYPRVFIILGNDDGRFEEDIFIETEAKGIWEYIHNKKVSFNKYTIYGYSYVPPTPFLLKDWEKYDVSRYVDPGCVSPEEGQRTIEVPLNEIKYSSIKKDLEKLIGNDDLSNAILLFHTPPYQTNLDYAQLDGKMIDHVPLDVHVGSIAVKRLIEKMQPLITLHGHVHESARITGSWKELLGKTHAFSAAHDGPELSLVKFDPDNPEASIRELL